MAKYDYWITEEGLKRLEAYARDGLTDEQIAHNMGIAVSTYYEWKKKCPEFSEALKKGKEVVDIEVENALLKRAMGYTYEETVKENIYNKEQERYELTVTKRTTKEVLPDTTAQIFWLKNRKPEEWRDKQELDLGNKDGKPFKTDFSNLTTEQLKELLKV